MKTGQAFRFEIPPHLRFCVSNNILEYLAEVVAIWLGILEKEVGKFSCSFSGTDNTSAIGWTYKSNFCDSTKKPHLLISRLLARLVMDSQSCLYTQHLKGIHNIVVDALSRDFHLSNLVLTSLLKYFYPT